jgi:hypothetical protein
VAIAIVGGAMANKPLNGGEAWVRLSWILGLRRLGFDIYFAEVLDAAACVDGTGGRASFAESVNRAHLEAVVEEFGLHGRVALLDEEGASLYGLGAEEMGEVAEETELLFDLSGHLGGRANAARARRRVYVDLDPGFTQVWHSDPALVFSVSGYDRHVTVGLNVGAGGCSVPAAGVEWIPTLPPVLLEEWSPAAARGDAFRFTSVATWRTPFGAIEIGGRVLGLKHHEFRRMLDLPERVEGAEFELALDIHSADAADRQALEGHGWSIVSPRDVAASPGAFRDYVRASGAELSVAQPAYVETRSGWFSDRSAAYLAAGRPALVQDTGLGAHLTPGEGLLTFSSPSQAAERARRIVADPARHARAARALAETHLDSDLVLGRLLGMLGGGG